MKDNILKKGYLKSHKALHQPIISVMIIHKKQKTQACLQEVGIIKQAL